jgi:hypothetical protein
MSIFLIEVDVIRLGLTFMLALLILASLLF